MQNIQVNLQVETAHDLIKKHYLETGGNKLNITTAPSINYELARFTLIPLLDKIQDFFRAESNFANMVNKESDNDAKFMALVNLLEPLIDVVISTNIVFAALDLPYDDFLAHKIAINAQKRFDDFDEELGALTKHEDFRYADFFGLLQAYLKFLQSENQPSPLPPKAPIVPTPLKPRTQSA